eukprot:CAMPEP_0119501696 /NCGR_PEP_ID=MMETSP1344-20130328/23431_1 /TAXON_ID=236787 /ORGANISM="Florenciella parvula, Strain CCMP2471" /LENGTH=41 /DNA_ID= /DNA_START= /DNA_END= /DNA_ORIENTATION=
MSGKHDGHGVDSEELEELELASWPKANATPSKNGATLVATT